MVRIVDSCNEQGNSARENMEMIAGLAKKIFNCSKASWGTKDIVVFDDPSKHIACIYPESADIYLFNPLYAEEAKRFADAFEVAFKPLDSEVRIWRRYYHYS